MDKICTVCKVKIHLGSLQCCMKTGFSGLEGYKIYLISIFLFLLCLIETGILLSRLLSDLSY